MKLGALNLSSIYLLCILSLSNILETAEKYTDGNKMTTRQPILCELKYMNYCITDVARILAINHHGL